MREVDLLRMASKLRSPGSANSCNPDFPEQHKVMYRLAKQRTLLEGASIYPLIFIPIVKFP